MYELKDELARHCLPAAKRDDSRLLAWVNSICLLFLLVGIFGARPGAAHFKAPPPIEEVIPVLVEPLPPPPTAVEEQNQEPKEPEKTQAPQVVVVVPDAPNINFSVPTIGNVLAPAALSAPPPLRPLNPPAALRNLPASLTTTGAGGERPEPPYPKIAKEQGMQGKVTVAMTVNEAGVVTDIHIKESSGFPMLDRSTMEYVRRHWTVEPGAFGRTFETSIIYRLEH